MLCAHVVALPVVRHELLDRPEVPIRPVRQAYRALKVLGSHVGVHLVRAVEVDSAKLAPGTTGDCPLGRASYKVGVKKRGEEGGGRRLEWREGERRGGGEEG